jgi:hypothetical protein
MTSSGRVPPDQRARDERQFTRDPAIGKPILLREGHGLMDE